jgi:HSP20 family molecular chaperone IbpA
MNDAAQTASTAGMARPMPPGDPEARNAAVMSPPVDVIEDATGITLIADMPGVPRDQLALRIEDDQLIIEGELSMQAPADMEASYVEIQRPRYRRSFTLSKELDSARIGAELNQGVLKLRIPKAESAQPRRIAIQVS